MFWPRQFRMGNRKFSNNCPCAQCAAQCATNRNINTMEDKEHAIFKCPEYTICIQRYPTGKTTSLPYNCTSDFDQIERRSIRWTGPTWRTPFVDAKLNFGWEVVTLTRSSVEAPREPRIWSQVDNHISNSAPELRYELRQLRNWR